MFLCARRHEGRPETEVRGLTRRARGSAQGLRRTGVRVGPGYRADERALQTLGGW